MSPSLFEKSHCNCSRLSFLLDFKRSSCSQKCKKSNFIHDDLHKLKRSRFNKLLDDRFPLLFDSLSLASSLDSFRPLTEVSSLDDFDSLQDSDSCRTIEDDDRLRNKSENTVNTSGSLSKQLALKKSNFKRDLIGGFQKTLKGKDSIENKMDAKSNASPKLTTLDWMEGRILKQNVKEWLKNSESFFAIPRKKMINQNAINDVDKNKGLQFTREQKEKLKRRMRSTMSSPENKIFLGLI